MIGEVFADDVIWYQGRWFVVESFEEHSNGEVRIEATDLGSRIVKHPHRACGDCDSAAVFIRRTQFSGDHYFCEAHAKQQADFQKEDPSYFFWTKLRTK